MTTYACKDCGRIYGNLVPAPLTIAAHRRDGHGEDYLTGPAVNEPTTQGDNL